MFLFTNQLTKTKTYEKETIYDETITVISDFLMQSYGDFGLFPKNLANSFSTCVDKQTIFGHIAETGQKVVQKDTKKALLMGEPGLR